MVSAVPSSSEEKYTSELKYRVVQLGRSLLRVALQGLVRFQPLDAPRDGYSIIIGCNMRLARMLGCNLKFLARQELRNVDRIFVVLDRPREELPEDIEPRIRKDFPALPLEFVYYSRFQRRVCAAVRWPWVQSWLSWSLGISRVRTRHAFLHDFDAMLLAPGIVEARYQEIRKAGVEFLGVRNYAGNGVVPGDALVTTFELMFDAAFVRRTFAPIDLFNHVVRFRGRRVDFDTFLYAQSKAGRTAVLPVGEKDMVHPSQLICHFEDLVGARRRLPAGNNLLLVPYFLHMAGAPEAMAQLTADLERAPGTAVPFFGRELELGGMEGDLFRWLVKQAYRLEHFELGAVRPEVRRYFQAADRVVARGKAGRPLLEAEERRIEQELLAG